MEKTYCKSFVEFPSVISVIDEPKFIEYVVPGFNSSVNKIESVLPFTKYFGVSANAGEIIICCCGLVSLMYSSKTISILFELKLVERFFGFVFSSSIKGAY